MGIILFILIFLIISMFISSVIIIYKSKVQQIVNNTKENFGIQNASSIPKVIYQTYKNKSLVPQKIYDNIKKYAPEYKHIIYDDNECLNFIKKNFGNELVDIFNKMPEGRYKADLFRYLILYKKGGIYLDIKTELIKPLSGIFNRNNTTYTVLSIYPSMCYQGIIATPKNNPLFMRLVELIKNTDMNVLKTEGLLFTMHVYDEIKKDIKKDSVNTGHNKNLVNNFDYYLFQEKCTTNKEDCYDGLDRYGWCCFVEDDNKKIIKTRYADFPW